MPGDVNSIDTIVVLMMENRSFDHLLGYRQSGGVPSPAGVAPGSAGAPFLLPPPGDASLPADPAHERADIALQLQGARGIPATFPAGGFPMTGFPASCASQIAGKPMVMGHYDGSQVPTAHFLAEHYATCDRWFAPLPAGTQPNRLMALSGYSRIDANQHLLARQYLVYDWLREHNIRWRVYYDTIPFVGLMEGWHTEFVFSDHFHSIGRLTGDVQREPDTTFPQVIFIEPLYTNADLGRPYDDHPPTSIARGQEFLRNVYATLSSRRDRWERTVLIVTYDEHGGFYDHVSPLPVACPPPANATWVNRAPFVSTGVRVPAFVVSPFAAAGTVYSKPLDHTAILQFIADVFADGVFSADVDARRAAFAALSPAFAPDGPGSILDMLQPTARTDLPQAGPVPASMHEAFTAAISRFTDAQRTRLREVFPGLTFFS